MNVYDIELPTHTTNKNMCFTPQPYNFAHTFPYFSNFGVVFGVYYRPIVIALEAFPQI